MENFKKLMGSRVSGYDLLEALEYDGLKIDGLLNIRGIIEYLGIELGEHPDFSRIHIVGNIFLKNGKPSIWCNPFENRNQGRKNFLLAHLLGHLMLHISPVYNDELNREIQESKKTMSLNKNSHWSYEEMEAHNFASIILMPSSLIVKQIEALKSKQDYTDKKTLIEDLSSSFEVSQQAMEYRLQKLGV